MANIEMKSLYGYNMENNDGFSVQLHLTTACDQNCKHCYMYNSDLFSEQVKGALSKEEWMQLIYEIDNFARKYSIRCQVAITGGDPILSNCFWSVLEYLSNCEHLDVVVMGNSYHIDERVARKMKKFGVISYQISLDGMQVRHDSIRKEGSFQDALRALKIVHNSGILATVMFTMMKDNMLELIPLYKYLNNFEFIDIFAFDKMVPIGNAEENTKIMSKEEYHSVLYEFYKEYVIGNYRLNFSFKDNMWRLLFYDLGLLDPFEKGERIISGCSALNSTISVLSDGKILPCRKMEIDVGQFPNNHLEDIILKNSLVKEFIDINSFKECKECELAAYCRGCMALRYAINKEMHSKDIYCWKGR